MSFIIPPAILLGPERHGVGIPEFRRVADMPEHRKAGGLESLEERIEDGTVQRLGERLAAVRFADEQLQSIAAAGDELIELRDQVGFGFCRSLRDPAKI